MSEREILVIAGAVVATTLLLTQASALAEIFATILSSLAKFVYVTLRAIFTLLKNVIDIIIRTILPKPTPPVPPDNGEDDHNYR